MFEVGEHCKRNNAICLNQIELFLLSDGTSKNQRNGTLFFGSCSETEPSVNSKEFEEHKKT